MATTIFYKDSRELAKWLNSYRGHAIFIIIIIVLEGISAMSRRMINWKKELLMALCSIDVVYVYALKPKSSLRGVI